MATSLKALRERLKVSQEVVARRADITLGTYRNAEAGKRRVQYSTAQAILTAINGVLAEQGKQPVGLNDLGLPIE